MSNHTPRPWFIEGEYVNGRDIGDATGHSVFEACCSCHGVRGSSAKEVDANGRLIVAAPEMYELLRDLSKSYDSDKSTNDLADILYALWCTAIQLLNKIEGGGE